MGGIAVLLEWVHCSRTEHFSCIISLPDPFRDAKNEETLKELGWNVVTIWECELANLEKCRELAKRLPYLIERKLKEYQCVENRDLPAVAKERASIGQKFIAFQARHPKPTLYDLTRFAHELNTSSAIVAEIINDYHGKKVFNYAHLRNLIAYSIF